MYFHPVASPTHVDMASATTNSEEAVYLHVGVIRGHYIYKSVWTPVLGEVLPLSTDEANDHDRFAVSVNRGEQNVGTYSWQHRHGNDLKNVRSYCTNHLCLRAVLEPLVP